jgi:sugar phosphate isomerase/epimerase
MLEIAICSFSFHRLLAAGKQDIFQYIKDCKSLGCTQLDPWNAHLVHPNNRQPAGHNPRDSGHLVPPDQDYLHRIKAAAREAGLPFGCIAVDGAHIYDPSEEIMRANRERAYRWIEVGRALGAGSIRIDAGGTEEMPDEQFAIIVAGYIELVARARDVGMTLLIENHWGPSAVPKNLIRILDAVPGLGLLLDSFNWKYTKQTEGWLTCAKYAKATHVKTFAFTEDGEELTSNIRSFVNLMQNSGYTGPWGIESVPYDGDEIQAARKTIALIKKYARC